MSKAFDKTWHKGTIFKLIQNGVSENQLEHSTDSLKDRKIQLNL